MPGNGLFDAGKPAMRQRAFILWRVLWLKGFGLRDRVLLASGPQYLRSRLERTGGAARRVRPGRVPFGVPAAHCFDH